MPSLMVERLGLTRWDPQADRRVLGPVAMVMLAVGGACLTGLLAQLRFQLLFTPVPVTGQVLGVLLCGAFLGGGYGALSQIIYVGAGAVGLPWFAGATGGLKALLGPSGGYLLGFIAAAYALGAYTRRYPGARTLEGQVRGMLMAVAIVYFFGVLHLMLVLRVSLARALALGVVPFVAVDVVKAVMAAMLTSAVLRGKQTQG